ncbi:ATP-dependent Clp protease proteolytic subunit, partial [Bacillus cereus]|nr:ATP-dependent Clp protease proteolytic subunit [Bacillus cereus]
ITAKRILKLKHDIKKMIAEKTGQPIERVSHDTERDYLMTAEEAKAYGIVDDVVTKK